MLGRCSQARLPFSISLSRRRSRGHEHGRFEAGADVVEPRLELGDGPALVAVDDGGDEVAGLDDDVAAVVGPGELAELGRDAVDEGVDVLRQRLRPRAGSVMEGRPTSSGSTGRSPRLSD